MQDGDDDPITKRIADAVSGWLAPARKEVFQSHIEYWAANPPQKAAASEDLQRLSAHVEHMFAGEDVVVPDVLGEMAPARRVALYLGFAPGKPDYVHGPWESMRPKHTFKSQMAHLASQLQHGWEVLGPEKMAGRPWVDLGCYTQCVAFCVPCVLPKEWNNEQTREAVPQTILRYAAFYLLTALRILRPACVVVGNYEAAKMLTFVHEYAHCATADSWLGAATLPRNKMVCPPVHGAAYVRIGLMGFHVFRFHVPYYKQKLADQDFDGTQEAFNNGVTLMMETLNPLPRDALTALVAPTGAAAKCRKKTSAKRLVVSGQPALSFASKKAP